MPKRTSDSLLPPPDHCPTVSCINEPNQDRGLTNVHGKTSSTLECVALAAQSGDLDELVRLAAVGEHVDTVNALGITPLRLVTTFYFTSLFFFFFLNFKMSFLFILNCFSIFENCFHSFSNINI